jgi:hypothetical protein
VTAYVLQSTRYHGALIKDAQSRDPKLFASRLQAWWFKVKRRKWHWRVVSKSNFAASAPVSSDMDAISPTLHAARAA